MGARLLRRFRDLLDVDFGTPADGDVVTYDAGGDELVLSTPAPTGPTGPAGGVLGGTYPNPSFAADMATQAELDALAATAAAGDAVVQASVDTHVADATDAHDASAISVVPAGTIAATNVQDALEEIASEAAAASAPGTADYLVGTSQAGLSAEIVVGTSPGGELGGTWASPTVDATHSGSSHASVQSAAEATAAAALAAHEADTTNVHGIADTANLQPLDSDLTAIAALSTTSFGRALLTLADAAALLSTAGAAAASHAHAGEDITSGTVADARIASTIARDSEVTSAISALSSVYQPLDSDLTAIAALSTTSFGRSLLTQADAAATRALLDLEPGTDFPSLATFNDHSARHESGGADAISIELADLTDVTGGPPNPGEAPVWDGDSFELTDVASQAELDVLDGAFDTHAAATTSVHGITDTADLLAKSLYDANTVLAANADNTPAALTMGASTILARLAAGNIKAASVSEIVALLAAYVVGGTDVALADGGTGASLADPNADRIMFWDDSAGAVTWLTPGTNLTITGTSIDASGSGSVAADDESLVLHVNLLAI